MKNLKDLFKTVMPQYFMYMGPRRTHCVAKFEVLSPTRVQFKLNPKFDKFIIDLEDPEGTGTIRVKDGVLQLDHKVFGAMEFIPMTRGTNHFLFPIIEDRLCFFFVLLALMLTLFLKISASCSSFQPEQFGPFRFLCFEQWLHRPRRVRCWV